MGSVTAVQTTPTTTTTAAVTPQPTVTSTHTDYPLSPTSQQTASLLTQSKSTIPHYYLTIELDLSSLLSLRDRINTKSSNNKISINDFLIKAIAIATKSIPSVNASWISEDYIRMYHDVHINTYVGTGNDLQVVLLKDVDKRGLSSLSNDISTIIESISTTTEEEEEQPSSIPSSYQGMGTFTFINLGMYGILNASSIIPTSQCCVLTCGSAEEKIIPCDDDKGYKTSTKMSITLSCDHRVVDGAIAAQWLQGYKNLIENPDLLLL